MRPYIKSNFIIIVIMVIIIIMMKIMIIVVLIVIVIIIITTIIITINLRGIDIPCGNWCRIFSPLAVRLKYTQIIKKTQKSKHIPHSPSRR